MYWKHYFQDDDAMYSSVFHPIFGRLGLWNTQDKLILESLKPIYHSEKVLDLYDVRVAIDIATVASNRIISYNSGIRFCSRSTQMNHNELIVDWVALPHLQRNDVKMCPPLITRIWIFIIRELIGRELLMFPRLACVKII